jgi:hypothetical protein
MAASGKRPPAPAHRQKRRPARRAATTKPASRSRSKPAPKAAILRTLSRAKEQEHIQRDITRDSQTQKLQRESNLLRKKYEQAAAENEALRKQLNLQTELQRARSHERFRRAAAKPHSESSAVLVLTDWHSEERVDPEVVNGLNEFNPDIASRRIKKTFQKTVEMLDWMQGFARISQLIAAILGDMITNVIHDELLEGNYMSPTQASLFVLDHLYSGFEFLLRERVVKSILVPTCDGNHARTTKFKRIATAADNSFEWQMYQVLQRMFRHEPRIQFKIGRSIHNWVPIQGFDCRFSHGDDFSFQGGVGGITIPVNKKIAQWNKSRRADYDFFGHWHQFLRHRNWLSCGCLIGLNAFGLHIGAEYQEPSQTLAVINRQHGMIFAEEIFLEERRLWLPGQTLASAA